MPWVRIKEGVTHRSGTLKSGDVVEVSKAEVISFGDKFEPLGDEEPMPVDEEPMPTEEEPVMPTEAAIAYAEEHTLDLSKVQGTGREGRITLPDVRMALQVENSSLEDIKAKLAVAWNGEDGNS